MIWIVGARGMLGQELAALCRESAVSCVESDIDVDIRSEQDLRLFAGKIPKDLGWIINCAAYTAVDKAESEPEKAEELNVTGARNLAAVAAALGAGFVHISTDYVFPGTANRELTEDDAVGPVGVYGRTKLDGETAVQETCPEHLILRTSWLYGLQGSNFVHTMIRLMNERDVIRVVDDQTGSPTWTYDLAAAILSACRQAESRGAVEALWGIYHYSGEGSCTWYEFASEIYRLARERGIVGSDCRVEPCSSSEYPTPARRPTYSLLSKDKIRSFFEVETPHWKQSLACYLDQWPAGADS